MGDKEVLKGGLLTTLSVKMPLHRLLVLLEQVQLTTKELGDSSFVSMSPGTQASQRIAHLKRNKSPLPLSCQDAGLYAGTGSGVRPCSLCS